jgi:hypothetical protein
MFMELFPELSKAISPDYLAMAGFYEASNDPDIAERVFRELPSSSLRSERSVVKFFVEAYDLIDEFGVRSLTGLYVEVLRGFFERYNLRFRIQVPFEITVEPGALFHSMLDEVTKRIISDSHLCDLDSHLRRAFSLLARDGNLTEVNRCISQTFNYLEGIAGTMPGLAPDSLTSLLGKMKGTWPHAGVRTAIASLYGFGSEYPDLRHGGNEKTRIRELQLRDAVVIPMALLAFSGYFVAVDYEELLCVRANDDPDEISNLPEPIAAHILGSAEV